MLLKTHKFRRKEGNRMTIKKKAGYLSDYEIVRGSTGKKRLVYHGDFYLCPVSDSQWLRYRRLMLSASFLYVFLWCAASLADPSSLRGSGTIYVILPYAALCFPGLIGLGRTVRLQRLSQQLERMDYDQCVVSLQFCTVLMIVLGFLAAGAQFVHIAIHSAFSPGEWVAAFCFLAIGAAACAAYRMQRKYPCENIGKGPGATGQNKTSPTAV